MHNIHQLDDQAHIDSHLTYFTSNYHASQNKICHNMPWLTMINGTLFSEKNHHISWNITMLNLNYFLQHLMAWIWLVVVHNKEEKGNMMKYDDSHPYSVAKLPPWTFQWDLRMLRTISLWYVYFLIRWCYNEKLIINMLTEVNRPKGCRARASQDKHEY